MASKTHAVRTIRGCMTRGEADPGSVAAVSFDGQIAGIGSVDGGWGTPTCDASCLDTRCRAYLQEGRITSLAGGPPSISRAAKIPWWMHEGREVFPGIAKFVVPGGYVADRMAGLPGEQAFIDRTYLHFTCFSGTAAGRRWEGLLEEFGVDASKLRRVCDPSEEAAWRPRLALRVDGGLSVLQ